MSATAAPLLYLRITASDDAKPADRALDGRYVLKDDLLSALRHLSLSRKRQAEHRVAPGEFVPWTDPAVLLLLAAQSWVDEHDRTVITLAGREALRTNFGTKP